MIAVGLTAGTAAAQPAVQPVVRVDAEDACGGSEGLPAISRDRRVVAVVWCWSDLSDARSVELRFYDVRSGRLRRGIVLDHASTGGADPMSTVRRRRAAERATTVLRRGRFAPLPGADLEATRAAWAARLDGYPAHPFCCGIEDPAIRTCTLPAEIHRAWALPTGALLLELITTTGPDGCEHGPDHRLVR